MTTYDDALDDMVDAVATSCAKIKHAIKKEETDKNLPKTEGESVVTILQQQLNSAQSNV